MTKLINKKNVVIAVIVATLIGVSAYMLANKKSDVKTNTEKTSEVTTKEDKKNTIKSDTKKEDKKDNKKEGKEDKKSDTKVEETKTTEVTDTNTSSNVSTSTSATENNNVSNSATNNSVSSQPTSTPCVPTYTTVNHPEVGHYEQTLVMPAYDEPVYEMRMVGGQTGRIYNNTAEFANQEEDFSYAIKQVQVDTIHHDAEYNQVWVVDQQAWTETVASGC